MKAYSDNVQAFPALQAHSRQFSGVVSNLSCWRYPQEVMSHWTDIDHLASRAGSWRASDQSEAAIGAKWPIRGQVWPPGADTWGINCAASAWPV